jgi:hypothetical protein
MCSWKDTQWAVIEAWIIQVQAQSHYLSQRAGGCESVSDACLGRPWAPSRNIAAFTNRQGGVLVPGDKPVPGGRLVEDGRL